MSDDGRRAKVERLVEVAGVRVPTFIYGTAWKEEATESLAALALASGFRAFDTANQRRHYFEAGVGDALAAAVGRGEVARAALFLQTKFTFARGQDHRLPYDPQAGYREQVLQSLGSSLEHLHTDHVDSYVLHGPSRRGRLGAADHEVWQAMAELAARGQARLLGVSNVSVAELGELLRTEAVRPAFVQNRCFAETGWDRDVRQLCAREGIRYQAFSLLTANAHLLGDERLVRAADRIGATPSETVFRFALEVGMLPLTGTSSAAHMKGDLAVYDLPPLTDEEVRQIDELGR